MYSEPCNRAVSSPESFRRGGYGAPHVGGGCVGGGVVGSAVGVTRRSGETPANDTYWLRPEKMLMTLRVKIKLCVTQTRHCNH